MYVVIAGGGRTGTQLAKSLLSIDHSVSLIEYRKEILSRIHREIPTESIVTGNPLDLNVLEQADIKHANVFAATTTSDSDNLTMCYVVRELFGVKRTIARVNNPRNAWLFGKMFHVDVAVNQAEILSRLIEEEMSLGDMMTLLKFRRGKYSLVEEKIPENASAVGIPIKDLPLPDKCVIAAVIRNGELVFPHGDTTLEVDDEVLAITDPEGAKKMAELFDFPNRKKPLTD
jgi:trk system potassium uptake protein TrkA